MPMPDRAPAPGEVCSHELGVEVVPPLGTDQPGPVVAKERVGIREVHVSMALMDEFLKCALDHNPSARLCDIGLVATHCHTAPPSHACTVIVQSSSQHSVRRAQF